MLHLKIRVSDEKHAPRAITKIVKELNTIPKSTPFTVEFYPAGDLNRGSAQELLQKLPLNCVGIKLSSLTNSSWSYPSIEHIEAICGSLPPQIKILDARNVLAAKTSLEHIMRFFRAIPKSITHLNLQYNHLGNVSFALPQLFPLLHGVSLLDVRDNFKSEKAVNYFVQSLLAIPGTVSSLYTDLKQSTQEIHQQFYINLPHHIQVLGLVADDFYHHDGIMHLASLVPPTVTTLKWLCSSKSPTVALINHTPDTVKTLDLTNCSLYSVRMSLATPQNITTLILDNNQLYLWPITQLMQFLKELPETVRTISLAGNKLFAGKTEEEIRSLREEFKSQSLRNIILENSEIRRAPCSKQPPLYSLIQALFSQTKPDELKSALPRRAAL